MPEPRADRVSRPRLRSRIAAGDLHGLRVRPAPGPRLRLGAMTESLPYAVRAGWQPGARFLFRLGRRTLAESLYLLTAPVIAAAGLVMVLGGLCARTAGLLWPGGSPVPDGVLAPVRWFADLERW